MYRMLSPYVLRDHRQERVPWPPRNLTLNMGPQHPSHARRAPAGAGAGRRDRVKAVPHIGYLHTGMEKSMENEPYQQAIVITDRMDYLSAMNNNLAYAWR